MLQNPHVLLTFDKVQKSLAPATRNDISTSKSGPNPWFLNMLTSTCASRHNGVHFFDISISKSGPRMVCFAHFDLEMCFASRRRALFRQLNFQKRSECHVILAFSLETCFVPQRRALFRHRNFQKWSEREVFLAFSLANVLRATTACTFSTSQPPKAVRT